MLIYASSTFYFVYATVLGNHQKPLRLCDFFIKVCNLKPFVGLCYRFNNLSYLYKMHE
jgi:hypothetical protein